MNLVSSVQKTDCSQINVITIRPVHENKIHHIVNPTIEGEGELEQEGEAEGRAKEREKIGRGEG